MNGTPIMFMLPEYVDLRGLFFLSFHEWEIIDVSERRISVLYSRQMYWMRHNITQLQQYLFITFCKNQFSRTNKVFLHNKSNFLAIFFALCRSWLNILQMQETIFKNYLLFSLWIQHLWFQANKFIYVI